LATSASPAKTDEPIEMLFGVRNPGTVGRYHTVDNFRSFFQSFEKHCGCLLLSMPQTLSPYVKVSAQGGASCAGWQRDYFQFRGKMSKNSILGEGREYAFSSQRFAVLKVPIYGNHTDFVHILHNDTNPLKMAGGHRLKHRKIAFALLYRLAGVTF